MRAVYSRGTHMAEKPVQIQVASECHRTIKWFGLEGTFEDHLVQHPAMGETPRHCRGYHNIP